MRTYSVRTHSTHVRTHAYAHCAYCAYCAYAQYAQYAQCAYAQYAQYAQCVYAQSRLWLSRTSRSKKSAARARLAVQKKSANEILDILSALTDHVGYFKNKLQNVQD